jgi:hypothetical protein
MEDALREAANCRLLRSLAIGNRKTPDLIGTYCIEHGHSMLHADRDFEPSCACISGCR